MKTLKVKIAAVLLLVISLGYSQENKMMHHDHNKMDSGEMKMVDNEFPEFKDEKTAVAYAGYSNLKAAILKSDQARAKEEAEQLLSSLAEFKGADQLQKAATKLTSSSDLESQKAAFSEFSNAFASFLEGKIQDNQLYLARCPMANNNSGGFWLNHEEAIQNPFFGGKMLKCGNIQDIIK
jgi:hypothetical protein